MPRNIAKMLAIAILTIMLSSTLAGSTTLSSIVPLPPLRAHAESSLPKISVIKLWSVTHKAYMAKFIGEKYVAVFTEHGDVSLDKKYVSVMQNNEVYIYETATGKLVKHLVSDADGDTWNLETGSKVWDRSGFFSGNGMRMIEDVEAYGTNSRVVDTSSWTTIPIDWGFTDTTYGHFYAAQLDYYGTHLAVGYIYNGTLLVFEYDSSQNKYVLVFKHTESGNYGRRIQMTLDGKFIVVGGLNCPYLDIWRWNNTQRTYVRVVHYQLPDPGGVTALGISDPYKIGYIIIGTDNGWAIIAHYNITLNEFKVVFQEKFAPDNSWVYNPFYDRWIPKSTEVFALCSHRDSGRPGYALVYDILTNSSTVIHFADAGTPQWSAAAISPEGNYVFLGNSLYLVVRRDPQSGNPRVRLWATGYYTTSRAVDLGTPLVIAPPQIDLHSYFFGGRITVTSLLLERQPTLLCTDPDAIYGRLGNLLKRNYVHATPTEEVGGYVNTADTQLTATSANSVTCFADYVIQSVYWWNGHGFGGSTVANAVVVDIPLKNTIPLSAYENIRLNTSISMATISFSTNFKDEVNGCLVTFVGFSIPQLSELLSRKVFEKWFVWYVEKKLREAVSKESFQRLVEMYAEEMAKSEAVLRQPEMKNVLARLAWEKSYNVVLSNLVDSIATSKTAVIARTLSKALKVAGRALIVVAAVDWVISSTGVTYTTGEKKLGIVSWGIAAPFQPYVYEVDNCTFGLVYAVPIIVDTRTGKKYAAVQLALPVSEWKYAADYERHISEFLRKRFGVEYTQVDIMKWGKDFKDYAMLLAQGHLPPFDFSKVINELSAAKGIPVDKMQIVAVKIVYDNFFHGTATLLQALGGGLHVYVNTVVAGHSILLKGETKTTNRVITDPATIAATLGNVTVNGEAFQFRAGDHAAYADFAIKGGTEKLTIVFNKPGIYATLNISYTMCLKKDMDLVDNMCYQAIIHYTWKNQLRLTRIEFVDMPYPMVYAEREFIWRYTHFAHDITPAFRLNSTVDDPSSPTGKRYYYVTIKDTKFIDPTNGGLLEPGKTMIFRYFFVYPPDASIVIYLNGTRVTSTLAQHATVVIRSYNISQTVFYTVSFVVKQLKGLEEVVVSNETEHGSLQVPANGSAYHVYNISKYVDEVMSIMKSTGRPAYLEITARIIDAEWDLRTANDVYRVVYYPPSSLYTLYNKTAQLVVNVYDATNSTLISGATVKAYKGTGCAVTAVTNATGYAVLNLTVGSWVIEVSALGYHSYSASLYVYGNMSFGVPLIPLTWKTPTPSPEPPLNGTSLGPVTAPNGTKYWWLSVQVLWHDGMAFHGALVTVRDNATGTVLFQRYTNGTGFVHFLVRDGETVKVEVSATNPNNASQTFYAYRIITVNRHWWVTFEVPWYSKYFEPEVAIEDVELLVSRGLSWFFGPVEHCVKLVLWTNTPQHVTVLVKLVKADTNETVSEETLSFDLPQGVFENLTWLPVDLPSGATLRAYAEIISYENDTDPNNNAAWSGAVVFKPYVDIRVFAIWRAVKQKVDGFLLPGDVIEIDVGMETNINTSTVPAVFTYKIDKHMLSKKAWEKITDKSEEVRAGAAGVVWRNFTLTIPWTDEVAIWVNATHPWEDVNDNNAVNISIRVDPDVKVDKVEASTGVLGVVEGGSNVTLTVHLISNVPAWVNATGTLYAYHLAPKNTLALINVSVAPNMTYKLVFLVPKPSGLFTEKYNVTVGFSGYDVYGGDNYCTIQLNVAPPVFTWIILIGAIIAAIIVAAVTIAAVKALRHAHVYIEQHYRFVKRRRNRFITLRHSIHEGQVKEEQKYRFVKRRKG